MSFAIKFREKEGSKQFHFVTPDGGGTRLRIHASFWTEEDKADKALNDLTANNQEFEFKKVPF